MAREMVGGSMGSKMAVVQSKVSEIVGRVLSAVVGMVEGIGWDLCWGLCFDDNGVKLMVWRMWLGWKRSTAAWSKLDSMSEFRKVGNWLGNREHASYQARACQTVGAVAVLGWRC